MASGLYAYGRRQFAEGAIHWKSSGGDTIKATLIDAADYTVNLATHQYMNTDTVPAASKVGNPVALTLLDPVDGVCDANNAVFSAVTGDQFEAIIIWKDGGGGGTTASGTTDILLAYIDGFTATTPNGGDINVNWDDGANKIFKL